MKGFLRKIQAPALCGMWMLWTVQIVLGGVWLAGNLGRVPNFRITGEILEISEGLVTDEYIGIAYPLLLRGAVWAERITSIPYFLFLYVLQLGTGFGALYKVLWGRKHRAFLALGVMTIPVVLQFYAAITPEALACSMLLLCVYHCWKGNRIAGGLWGLLGGLLIPEYFLFGGLVFLADWVRCLIVRREGRKKEAVTGLAVLLAAGLAAGLVSSLTLEEGSRGRMDRSFAAMALHRFVWPNFATSYNFWPSEVEALFDIEEMTEFSRIPETVLTEFGPAVERTYGVPRAREIYWSMAGSMLRVRTREILKDMAGDFLQYSVPLPALLFNRAGIGVTYDSWNYGLLCGKMPRWTNYYVSFAGLGFAALLVLGVLGRALSLGRTPLPLVRRLALLSIFLAAWYTLSASGMQDYRHAVFVSLSWGIGMAFLTEDREEKTVAA